MQRNRNRHVLIVSSLADLGFPCPESQHCKNRPPGLKSEPKTFVFFFGPAGQQDGRGLVRRVLCAYGVAMALAMAGLGDRGGAGRGPMALGIRPAAKARKTKPS
jgi:hypothetical protein